MIKISRENLNNLLHAYNKCFIKHTATSNEAWLDGYLEEMKNNTVYDFSNKNPDNNDIIQLVYPNNVISGNWIVIECQLISPLKAILENGEWVKNMADNYTVISPKKGYIGWKYAKENKKPKLKNKLKAVLNAINNLNTENE